TATWYPDWNNSPTLYEQQRGTIEVIAGETMPLSLDAPTALVPFELWIEDSHGEWVSASVYISTEIGQGGGFGFNSAEDGWYRGLMLKGTFLLNISLHDSGYSLRVPITVDEDGYSNTIILPEEQIGITLDASEDAVYGSPFDFWGSGYEPGESVEIRF